MTPAIREFVLAMGSSLPASIVAKATVTAAFGLMGARLAQRSRAAVRHVVLTATFGALLLLPVISLVAPPVEIGIKTASVDLVRRGGSRTAPTSSDMFDSLQSTGPADIHSTVAASKSFAPSFSMLLVMAWFVGAVLCLVPMLVGLSKIHSLRRSRLPWAEGRKLVDRLSLEVGLRRRVELALHEALPGPITSGMLHPAVLFPLDAQTWGSQDLNRALVHELEHVRRGDVLTHCLARAVCAVYWFHPLVWMAWRWLTLEAERSCDDAVIGRWEATAYADQLVALARRLLTAARSPLLAMANRSDLATRVGAVLDTRQRRGRAGRSTVVLACTGVVLLVLSLSPIRTISTPQFASAQSPIDSSPVIGLGAHLPSFEVASVKPSRSGESTFAEFNWSRFTVRSKTAKWLITFAYAAFSRKANLSDDQLSGGPAWIDSEPYDINAKVEDSLAEKLRQHTMGEIGAQIRLMIQSLLADRFKLKIHHETEQRPVYALVVAKGGPKFLHTRFTLPQPATANPGGKGGKVSVPETPGMRRYKLRGPVANFAALLSGFPVLGRQVVDNTGIEGNYEFDFEIPLHQYQAATTNGGPVPSSDSTLPNELSGPSIFTLLREQLGLKLVPTKGPVDVIVIDHIERPSAE